MKYLINKRDKLNQINSLSYKLQELLLLIFSFVIVFSYKIASYIIILLLANWLFRFITRGNSLNKKFPFYALLCVSLFTIAIVGLVYTSSIIEGIKHVERWLALLIFPIIFVTSPSLHIKVKYHIFRTFIIACSLASLYAIASAIYRNFSFNGLTSLDISFFTGDIFASSLGIHPTYLSLYFAFGVVLSINIIEGNYKTNKWTGFYFLSIILLSLTVIFLYARTVSAILILYLIYKASYFLFSSHHKRLKFKITLSLSILIITLALIPSLQDGIKARLSHISYANSKFIGTNYENGVNQRLFLWKRGVEIIKENPLFGVGTGDYNLAFDRHLIQHLTENPQFTESRIKAIHSIKQIKFNMHNQYLQVAIQFGLIGIIILISMILIPLYKSLKIDNNLYSVFLTVIALTMLTECILNRSSGMLFYSFFNVILANSYSTNKEKGNI